MKNYIFDREKDDFLRDEDGEKIFCSTGDIVYNYLSGYCDFTDEWIDKNFFIMKSCKILHAEKNELYNNKEGDKRNVVMKFRKKPVVIDAIQWDGKNFDEVSNFTKNFHGHKKAYEDAEEGSIKSGEYYIHTPEGVMTATKGDWIIKGVHNEFYPCKPDIFEKTYEPFESSIQEGEERMFTLKEALEIWERGSESAYNSVEPEGPCSFHGSEHLENKIKYFKDKFGINLEK